MRRWGRNLLFTPVQVSLDGYGDDEAVHVYRPSMRFTNSATEAAFLLHRKPVLCRTVFLYSFAAFVLALYLNVPAQDWDTSNGRFRPVPDAVPLARLRNYFCLALGGLSGVLVIMTSPCIANRLSSQYLEIVFVVFAIAAFLLLPFTNPWYCGKLLVDDPMQYFEPPGDFLDSDLMLWLTWAFTVIHVGVPIRWFVLTPLHVVCLFAYAGPVFIIGTSWSLGAVHGQMIGLLLLVTCVSGGKRSREMSERSFYAMFLHEKNKRFNVEYALSTALDGMVERRMARDTMATASSTGFTTATDNLFQQWRAACSQGKAGRPFLEELVELGVKEHWLVPCADLQPNPSGVLGSGSFGIAMLASWLGSHVVLKIPREGSELSADRLLSTAEELRVLRQIRHPRIAVFYGACVDPQTCEVALVLEYVQGVTVHQGVCEPPGTPSTGERCLLAADMCCAIRYLHGVRPAIIHGDIKGENVMVEPTAGGVLRAKLVDFGLSQILQGTARAKGGSIRWMAPELALLGPQPATTSSDVFSLGALLFKLVVGRTPHADQDASALLGAAREGRMPALAWPLERVPLQLEAEALVNRCCDCSPSARPTTVAIQAEVLKWGKVLHAQQGVRDLGLFLDCLGPAATGAAPFGLGLAEARLVLPAASPEVGSGHLPKAAASCAPVVEGPSQMGPQGGRSLTPTGTKIATLLQAGRGWGCEAHPGACCQFHCMVREMRSLAGVMLSGACHTVEILEGPACKGCGLVRKRSQRSCTLCGTAGASTAAGDAGISPPPEAAGPRLQ